ncbi:MAG: glucose-1-phosphate adenylyltransferase subunit GlgD [Clostridiales bacterium]|jgi:glucose-1-phosphate adenylyltransferase|nr:glucose-1-phosphate adenylyltransferase subunit GlgD [Clostridiales bacterium]
MRANNVLGIIYSNSYDSVLPELTPLRAMGSVPFAGRYRLIDFPLSNMVNCGITNVGVITKGNYRSLMDHVGSGKAWDLSRKRDGLFVIPPFSDSAFGGEQFRSRIEALHSAIGFIERSKAEYVLMCDSNVVCNMDFGDLIKYHSDKGADITLVYKYEQAPKIPGILTFALDASGRVSNEELCRCGITCAAHSLNIFLLRKSLLERLLNDAVCLGYKDFDQDIIASNVENLKIFGYECDSYARTIDSLQTYYEINMDLLQPDQKDALFAPDRPVFTKVHDDMPSVYSHSSNVKNSLIADGCKIEGQVENCVFFRRVNVGRGAKLKNCVIMQDTFIGEGADLNCVITDKNAVIKPDKVLSGDKNYPFFLGKGIVI